MSPTTISLTSLPSLPVMNLKELIRSSSPLFTLKIVPSEVSRPEFTRMKESLPT